jgi:integral membrane protein
MPETATIMNKTDQRSTFGRYFLPVSLAEGASFLLLLCVAMPLKYAAGLPIAVTIMGTLHGLLFIGYVLLALDGWRRQRWSIKRVVWVLVMAVLPTGAFIAERSVRAELAQPAAAPEPVAA